MHIAAASQTPKIVALFGPENPHRYRPYVESDRSRVLSVVMSCSPCTLFECETMECLSKIKPDLVKRAIESLLVER